MACSTTRREKTPGSSEGPRGRRCHDDGVSELLLELGPLALAILLSPFPLVPVVLLLLTDRAVANGGAFLLGWFTGLVLLAAVFTVVTSAIEL